MNGRALEDPDGDWWDRPGEQKGTLQPGGSILWDDGALWWAHFTLCNVSLSLSLCLSLSFCLSAFAIVFTPYIAML